MRTNKSVHRRYKTLTGAYHEARRLRPGSFRSPRSFAPAVRPFRLRPRCAVYIDYVILGCLSLAMFVYAYIRRPEASSDDDANDGGLPTEGDGAPVNVPPTIVVDRPDDVPVRDDARVRT